MDIYSLVIQFIQEAGDTLPPIAGKIEDIGVKKTWLTEKDLEIETQLKKIIQTFPGDHQIFAEELNDTYQSAENVWIIDPISHTFGFIHGLHHYAVVVAHMYQGKVVFACMYDPSVKELFVANETGVTLNSQPVSVNQNTNDLCLFYDPQMPVDSINKSQRLEIYNQVMDLGRNKVFGSEGLMFAYVACGRAHGSIALNKDAFTSLAGAFMVTKAGGQVSGFQGQAVDLNTTGIIASNGIIHSQLLNITQNL